MLGGVQVVPFHRPPKKKWANGVEKKRRLFIDLSKEEDDLEEEKPTYYDDVSESSEESEASFDMQEYVAGLLPGDLVDGKKPTRGANTAHLEDLRYVAEPKDRLKYFKFFYRYIKRLRMEERNRRKHYILKEWENRIKEYDEKQKQAVLDKMEEHRKEVLLERHRSDLRRIRNSKKKVEKSAHIELFTADLIRRDAEAKKMQFYCTNLTNWAIEGYNRKELEVAGEQRIVDEAAQIVKDKAKAVRKQQRIEEDAAVLQQDKLITAQIETIMVQYGMIEFEPDLAKTNDEKLDAIFNRNRAERQNNHNNNHTHQDDRGADHPEGATLTIGDTTTTMAISMKKDVDLMYLRKRLRKSVHRRTASLPTPFEQDLSGTGQILTLKAQRIGETGALSLAAELTRGACPTLETLDLNKCEVRSEGMGRIFQGIKTANLLSLRVLKLRGNFLRAPGLQYMMEICPSGVFMNLAVLDLSQNELGDEGVGVIVNIILQGHFMNLVELNLQHNSITDQGFNKMVSVMKSLKDTKCPFLERLKIENNLVSAGARRRNAPYPACFSF